MIILRTFSEGGERIKATKFELCRHPELGKYEITHYSNGAKKYTHFDHPDEDYVEHPDGTKLYRDGREKLKK